MSYPTSFSALSTAQTSAVRRGILDVVVRPLLPLLALGLLLSGSSCDGTQGEAEGEGEGDVDDGFADHTLPSLGDVAAYAAVAAVGPSSESVKLVITRFGADNARLRFFDSAFYGLHDEWYWFRLLNGAGIEGLATPADAPLTTSHGPFASVREIFDWATTERAATRELPLDLTFVEGGERLYSPRFYDLALFDKPRELGIATLVHFPAVTGTREEIWALELEFSDTPNADDLRVFFAQVEAAVGAEIGAHLLWITRSRAQEEIAQGLPDDLRARTISFADVVVPGQIEVYAEGLTAGRLLSVRRGDEALLATTRATDVLVVEDVPDFLPACAALLTAKPQTALAHVNLLARNRGIPNAFIAGVDVDANLDQLARVRAPVIVSAHHVEGGVDTLVVKAMDESDFTTWRSLTAAAPAAVPAIDLSGVDDVYDLQALDFADADALRPILGGKSTGFLALLDAGVSSVDTPQAISIKPYQEHLTTTALEPRLVAMLEDRSFQGDVTVRKLVLEGPAAVDPAFVAAFRAGRPAGNVLRDLVDEGGVQGILLNTPMAPSTLASILDALELKFGRYADEQGLRFRSSSNIEDAEGFNGAGLYTSNTGRLHPDNDDDDVEAAILLTWASYWGAEAFEERRLAAVDHLSGSMGVTVHANFDDRFERNNGVALFTVPPAVGGPFVLEVNQQEGALSVTNPPPGSPHLPEIDRVILDAGAALPHIERARDSTVLLPGDHVLDDDTLLQMFDDARTLTERWLAVDNAALPSAQRRSTLTLDFETRFVEPGWPALRSGLQREARLVWKQARTLEPTSTRAPAAVQGLPIPKDILARARRVVRHSCEGDSVAVFVTEVVTDVALAPDMGFALEPFTSFVIVDVKEDAPEIGAAAGTRRSAVHTAFASVDHPTIASGADPWSIDIEIADDRQATLQLQHIAVDEAGTVIVENGGTLSSSSTCESTLVFAAPAGFLAGLLE